MRLHGLKIQADSDFYASLQAAMHEEETPHALIFLHGFNVSFEEAAIRASQLGCDLAVPGATAFFSWPSRGNLVGYPADEASIEASERAITDFLVQFAARSGAAKIHIRLESRLHRLATGGYVLGTCVVYCGIVAIHCQAVDSSAREASTVWRQVATFWELALSAAES